MLVLSFQCFTVPVSSFVPYYALSSRQFSVGEFDPNVLNKSCLMAVFPNIERPYVSVLSFNMYSYVNYSFAFLLFRKLVCPHDICLVVSTFLHMSVRSNVLSRLLGVFFFICHYVITKLLYM